MRVDWRDCLRGFYAVLDRDDEALARDLLSGARVLQVRMKDASAAERERVAKMARRVTREHRALLVINDWLDLAGAVEADGVHLGQDDLPLPAARVEWRGLIGISTHDLAQVEQAVTGGADYVGFGPVFPTATKRDPDPVQGIEGLAAAVRAAGDVPVVAIGGITPERALEVGAAGAWAGCAIGAVNEASRPAEAAQRVRDRILAGSTQYRWSNLARRPD